MRFAQIIQSEPSGAKKALGIGLAFALWPPKASDTALREVATPVVRGSVRRSADRGLGRWTPTPRWLWRCAGGSLPAVSYAAARLWRRAKDYALAEENIGFQQKIIYFRLNYRRIVDSSLLNLLIR